MRLHILRRASSRAVEALDHSPETWGQVVSYGSGQTVVKLQVEITDAIVRPPALRNANRLTATAKPISLCATRNTFDGQ